jgi:hypothetical protein
VSVGIDEAELTAGVGEVLHHRPVAGLAVWPRGRRPVRQWGALPSPAVPSPLPMMSSDPACRSDAD